ncbi:MAG TPA: hypothetical protein VGK67_13575 [Myxococcales bacterium]
MHLRPASPTLLAPTLALALAAALLALAPAASLAAQSPAQKIAALAERGDFDGLALELASLDLESVPSAQRSSLAGTLSAAAERIPLAQGSIAVFCARRAAELQPTLARYGALGRIAQAAGDGGAQAESLEGTLRLAPNDAPSLSRLAALREKADPAAALALWRRAAENGGGDQAAQGAARCRRRLDEAARNQPAQPKAAPAKPVPSREPAAERPTRAAAAPKPPADAEPFKLVYSDKGGYFPNRDYGLKVVEVLERIRAFVCPRLGRCSNRTVEVRLFTAEEYDQKFAGTKVGRRAGFAGSAVNVSYAQSFTQDLEETLAHEFVHVTLHHRVPGVPAWLNEGLATYLDSLYTGNGGGRSGFIPTTLCLGIRGADAPKLSSLDYRFPWAGSFGESRPGYDYSCAVAQHLYGRGEGKVGQLLETMEKGQPVEAALKDVFGVDVEGLDQAVRATLPP